MMTKKIYGYKREKKQNPYIGFMSFNHFRGEALYSDCIVGGGALAGCETENYECYPVPCGVEENGREQGFHPDTSVAYIRALWKEFEPKQGEYNYAFIQNILDKAKEKGQTVVFRLMPHSTCARDDVPDWLKGIMDCPARPDGMRVKDSPKDPRYLKLFGKAIEKLGEKFDSDETLDCVDVSIGGAWGEGSQDFKKEDMEALMDIYIRVFKNTKLMGQFVNLHLINYILKKRSIGWRADGLGSPKHMNEIYPERFPLIPKDMWKTSPVSFESYWWISEWYRRGWDIDKIIDLTLKNHLSTFNTKSFPIQFELKDKIDDWVAKMGYHFSVNEVSLEDCAAKGGELKMRLVVENVGVAPIYNALPLYIRLKNENYEKTFETGVDIRKWIEGKYEENISIDLPKDISAGKYDIELGIGGFGKPSVVFASDAESDGDYIILSKVTIR
ncbi:MAG: DUF4832 domain-containing protein [Clostridia bacterium]|nr:DUF4832 domain-containing protein [Clostridia bacterium]